MGLIRAGSRSGVPSALLVSAQRQLRVMGTDIVRTPGTLAGPYGDLETPVEPDGDAGVSEDTRALSEREAGGKEGQPGRKPGGDPRP